MILALRWPLCSFGRWLGLLHRLPPRFEQTMEAHFLTARGRGHRQTKNKLAMKIKSNGTEGFTLVEIMIVVAIIGLLAAIAIPNFVKARNTAQASACINNMKQIDGAIDLFALENNKTDGDPVTANDVKLYIKGNEVPKCPAGNKDYVLGGTVASTPSVTCLNAASTPPHKLRP